MTDYYDCQIFIIYANNSDAEFSGTGLCQGSRDRELETVLRDTTDVIYAYVVIHTMESIQ